MLLGEKIYYKDNMYIKWNTIVKSIYIDKKLVSCYLVGYVDLACGRGTWGWSPFVPRNPVVLSRIYAFLREKTRGFSF